MLDIDILGLYFCFHFHFWGRRPLFDNLMLPVDDLGPIFVFFPFWGRPYLFDHLMLDVYDLGPYFYFSFSG